MLALRDYQLEAVDACARQLSKTKTALIVAATGSGKSIIIAHIIQRILRRQPSARVLVLCYVQEIIASNQEACMQLGIESGIYCAGLRKKETSHAIIHASRDSLAASPDSCGYFDFIIVDEVHTVGDKKSTRYRKLLTALDPKYIIGLTATPYRLDGGVIYGKGKLFESICYEIGMRELIKRGYLCPFEYPKMKSLVNTAAFSVLAGEYDAGQVSGAVENERMVMASFDAWEQQALDRRLTLFFCHSRAHAQLSLALFQQRFPQFKACYVDGLTHKETRATCVTEAKNGGYKAFFQVNTMTTGVNIPIIDCVMWLRPTMSTTLFVQGSGRGSRLYPNKKNCLVLDLVGNHFNFGSLLDPEITIQGSAGEVIKYTPEQLAAMGIDPEQMKGEGATKECKKCTFTLPAAAKKCPECGMLCLQLKNMFSVNTPTESANSEKIPCAVYGVAIHEHVTAKGNTVCRVEWDVVGAGSFDPENGVHEDFKDKLPRQIIFEYLNTNTTNVWVNKANVAKLIKIGRAQPRFVTLEMKNGFWRSEFE